MAVTAGGNPGRDPSIRPSQAGEAEELVELLARQMPIVIGAVLVVAPTAAYVHGLRLGPSTLASSWLVAAVVLAAFRALFVAAYWRYRQGSNLWFWRAGFMLGSLASGGLFGWFGWVVTGSGDGPLMLFIIMMLVGLTAGSVASLSADRQVYAAFALSAMGPIIVRFGLAPDETNRWMAVLGLVFLITHLGYSMLQNRTMRDLIRLRNQEKAFSRELAEARDRAERSSTEKTRLLLAAGHDLRQPLYAIRLLLDTLDAAGTDIRAQRIATIGESVKTISDLLERMLEAARAGAKGFEPRLAPVELDGIFRQVGVEFAAEAAAKSIDLGFVGTSRWVLAEPVLLTQILRNFVGNAVRYTANGRVLVGVRPRKGRLVIQVWDTGPGIEEADLPRIFEPFHQLANPARQAGRGHGLGLTIAKSMAEIIGGDIAVRSWPGKGSLFALDLPAAGRPGVAAATRHATIPEASGPGAGRVLLVEDHDPLREILREMLAGWGYTVEVAADAMAALALVDAGGAPDILVSDLRLPGAMDGLMLIREVRARAGRHIPAVLVTADPAVPDPGEAIRVLQKPVAAGTLRTVMGAALSDCPRVREVPSPRHDGSGRNA
ncbi:hybrid sensor histidine kinase/response regulator [Rhabdaerophilum sp. SD176]|uniref:hybrid sensor histidine kinase/response regulator n=1 Tax=Rhabdaerophilum sp. SD176 TaxID=2983548 RepID=UPI0024E01584|nr:hybrid sensor histidine kinase/response regulator [Rhabdaerophilum sp. SD176]